MGHHVVKPFKSVNRKFAAGDKVCAEDIDPTSATSFEQWVARGFIADEAPPAAAKPGRAAAPVTAE